MTVDAGNSWICLNPDADWMQGFTYSKLDQVLDLLWLADLEHHIWTDQEHTFCRPEAVMQKH